MTLRIVGITHHGLGRAEDGRLLPRVLPGEVVEAEGDEIRILTPSPDRVKAPCPHARTCGGCVMQHASDGFVAAWKQGIAEKALEGQGLSAPFRPMVTSPAQSRRRATLSGRKTKGGTLLGFHARASEVLVAVPDCKLLHPDLTAAFPAFEALVRYGGSRTAEVQLTVTQSLNGADVAVTGGKELDGAGRMDLARMAETHRFARLTWDGETVALREPPDQRFGRARVAPPPGAFLQATAEGEAALLSAVREAVGPARKIVDLFSGCGTFTLPLAETADVHAVEGEAAMLQALDKGARAATGLRRITVESRDLFRRPLEPDEFKGVDAVVIDPPRAGAEAQIACLARSKVPVIAHVSCNPVSFARDARTLVGAGYRIDWVQVVDQFRWSTHVELVARFSLA